MGFGAKRNRSGFTILEAVISTALFAVIILIMAGTLKTILDIWRKEEAKQNVHRQFVKIYSSLNNDLSLSSTSYLNAYCKGSGGNDEYRWLAFPYPKGDTGDNSVKLGNSDSINWQSNIIYYIVRPAGDGCQNWNCCAHKRLIRKTTTDSLPVSNGDNGTYDMYNPLDGSRISSYLTAGLGAGGRTVEENIFDLRITQLKRGAVSFELTVVRLEEAQRKINMATTNFADPNGPGQAFTEKIGWTIITNNL